MMHGGGWRSFLRFDESEGRPRVDRKLLGRVLAYARPYWAFVLLILVAMAVTSLLGLIPPLLYRELIDNSVKPPRFSPDEIRLAGVALPGDLSPDLKGTLIELDSGDGPEYWAVWHNFYVISRYNRSALYSMAVYQLGQEIVNSR